MFHLILSLLLSSIFLRASANWPADQTTCNTLPLASKQSAIKIPERLNATSTVGVKVTARSFIVVEPKSGAILYEKNSGAEQPPASITKLMTALVFLQHNPGWDKMVTMLPEDFAPGAVPSLLLGDQVTEKDLFYSMLVASSNEAANALSRSTGLSRTDFIFQMNLFAQLLKMDDSHFVDPSGLSDNDQSTAEDIVKLSQVAFSHSEVRKAGSTRNYAVTVANKNLKRNLASTDMALKSDFGDGTENYSIEAGKTGFTDWRVDDALRAEFGEQTLGDFIRTVELGNFLAHDDDVDFLVVQEAPHVHVGGTHRGPAAVDDGGLRVQHGRLQLVDRLGRDAGREYPVQAAEGIVVTLEAPHTVLHREAVAGRLGERAHPRKRWDSVISIFAHGAVRARICPSARGSCPWSPAASSRRRACRRRRRRRR